MKLIERKNYLDRLKAVAGTPDIKVITGVRRSGKSRLLSAFIDYIRNTDDIANIISIDYTDLDFDSLKEYHALHRYVKERFLPGRNNYLFIDEVQMCANFELAVNSLHASGNYDIYITGSNAFLLSSDLATLFTGRTYSIEVFPFSFAEYTEYFGRADTFEALNDYMTDGGMAGSYLYSDKEDRRHYLDDVFSMLIIRDVMQKYNIRNIALLDRIADYLVDNIGNVVSVKRIADTLISGSIKTNDKTIGQYIKYLCAAFGFYRLRRYDIRGKKCLTSNDKYYICDHSFRIARLGTRNLDTGRVLENIVALELMRRGYEVYAGVLYQKEIDFVAMKGSEKLYIQVSEFIDNPDTFNREYSPLSTINDSYPKLIIAKTHRDMYRHEGVYILDASKWLINDTGANII